ncbi:MAG: zinc ribbon domain-containing protein [Candidatus Poribacteria bacterium]|nr:zinc ribbon domain-containing protein [Candidatus Poribacteria bacterium]
MPIYEYQCQKCTSKFEVLQSLHAEPKELACPNCGEQKPKKVFSSFASVGNGKTETCQPGST